MMRRKLTRTGVRPVIAGLAVIVALLVTSVPLAAADQAQSGAPRHLPGPGHSGAPGRHLPGHHAASDHHDRAPRHGGHPGAPGR